MRKLMNVPLLLIPYVIYHLVAVGEDKPEAIDTNEVMTIALPSGAEWMMTTGHIVLILGLFFLVLEILKATWTTSNSPIIDHVASLALLLLCLLEFILAPIAGTSTFFLLTMMALVDVVGAFMISFTGARRDFGGA